MGLRPTHADESRLPVMLSATKHLLVLKGQKQILRRSAPQDDMLGDFRQSEARRNLLLREEH